MVRFRNLLDLSSKDTPVRDHKNGASTAPSPHVSEADYIIHEL